MKTSSIVKQPVWKYLQNGIIIHFNEIETEGGYQYTIAKVSESPQKHEIVSAIIESEYSHEREIALLNNFNGGRTDHLQEYEEYQAFRIRAKELATQIMSEVYP